MKNDNSEKGATETNHSRNMKKDRSEKAVAGKGQFRTGKYET